MIAADALAALRAFPVRPLDDILAPGPLLVLSPHPDDESLGCGGLIAAAAWSRSVTIALLTDGAGSHPPSPDYPAERLAGLREAEMREAIVRLGLSPSALHKLRWPDRHAPREGPELDRACGQLADLLAATGASTLLTTWGLDPHGDHVAASLIGRRAVRGTGVRLLEFPVWGWTLAADARLEIDPPSGARLDIERFLPAKRAAIAAHRSQTIGLPEGPQGFRLPPDFIGLFTGRFETFIDV